MASSWLDHLPSTEREKIRKRLRSPEEYERLREKVKGPEDLEREMEKNAEMADVRLALETDPRFQEKAQRIVRENMKEKGIETVLENADDLKEPLEDFTVVLKSTSHEPRLAILPASVTDAPTGKVHEALSLQPSLQQQLLVALRYRSDIH